MKPQVLNTWDQLAPRVHQRQCFCFPLDADASLEALRDHLRAALDDLATLHPYLAGRVSLLPDSSGRLGIAQGSSGIQLVVEDQRCTFPWTYDQLRLQGFPAKAFVDPAFDVRNELSIKSGGASVFEVHVRVIEKGLLLCIYSHHSVLDGRAVHDAISSLAAITRHSSDNLTVDSSQVNYQPLTDSRKSSSSPGSDTILDLLAKCPEYCLLDPPTGPTQFRMPNQGTPSHEIRKTGRIFFFGEMKIRELKRLVRLHSDREPSSFTLLAALSWAHITKARLRSPRSLLSSEPNRQIDTPDKVRLMIIADWRDRVSSNTVRSSPGNAVALPKTALDTGEVLAACGNNEASAMALGRLTNTIGCMVATVDEDFVSNRTALFKAVPDPRLIGVDVDQRDPCDFCFNSWRHFGGQTQWTLPGVATTSVDGSAMPDAIRRLQPDWNMGAGLILPAREGGSGYEVLITLDTDAMDILCSDINWKSWVDEIFE